jgi:hypothetical protein
VKTLGAAGQEAVVHIGLEFGNVIQVERLGRVVSLNRTVEADVWMR